MIQDLSAQKTQQASDWYFGYASRILAVHILDLRGSILSIQGKHEEAYQIIKRSNRKREKSRLLGAAALHAPGFGKSRTAFLRAGKFKEAKDGF